MTSIFWQGQEYMWYSNTSNTKYQKQAIRLEHPCAILGEPIPSKAYATIKEAIERGHQTAIYLPKEITVDQAWKHARKVMTINESIAMSRKDHPKYEF
jgi:hypothetical protein